MPVDSLSGYDIVWRAHWPSGPCPAGGKHQMDLKISGTTWCCVGCEAWWDSDESEAVLKYAKAGAWLATAPERQN